MADIPQIHHLAELGREVERFAQPEMFDGNLLLCGLPYIRVLLKATPTAVFEEVISPVMPGAAFDIAHYEAQAEELQPTDEEIAAEISPESVLEQLLRAYADFSFDRFNMAVDTKIMATQRLGRRITFAAMLDYDKSSWLPKPA